MDRIYINISILYYTYNTYYFYLYCNNILNAADIISTVAVIYELRIIYDCWQVDFFFARNDL